MKTLALEFSSDHRSAAVWVPASDQAPAKFGRATHTSGRQTPAFALIRAALDEAGVAREEIERIAVGLGPGSATGIRTAIALAEGWRLGRDIERVGVSSLECLAARLQDEGMRGLVHVAVDAQRNEFHLARFELGPEGVRELDPLRLASAAEVEALVKAGDRVVGPGLAARLPGARDTYPDALTLARLSLARTAAGEAEGFDAMHLRQPAYVKTGPVRPVVEPPGACPR